MNIIVSYVSQASQLNYSVFLFTESRYLGAPILTHETCKAVIYKYRQRSTVGSISTIADRLGIQCIDSEFTVRLLIFFISNNLKFQKE